jgi:glucokinase
VRHQGVQDRRLALIIDRDLTPAGTPAGVLSFPARWHGPASPLRRDHGHGIGFRRGRLLESGAFSTIETRGFALSSSPVIAVDLGGTRIRAAVIEPDGTRIARNERPTPTEEGPAEIVRLCVDAARRARDEAGAEIAASIAGIGISSPGPVDPYTGVILEPPNLGRRFRDIPIAAELARELDLPAFLDRDTNVAALGEQAFGAARGVDDFIYLTVSTGIGGAIVSRGEILHGPDGLAGELGHVPVEMDGPRCGCGGVGHVEAIASGVALAREARSLLAAGVSDFIAERAASLEPGRELSAKDVGEGALAGDSFCRDVMDRARRAIAAACVGYVNAFNPHRIVIGGSIAEADGDLMLRPIRDAIGREAFDVVARQVTVVPAELGGDVSLAGAQPFVMSRLDQTSQSSPATRSARPIAVSGGTHA